MLVVVGLTALGFVLTAYCISCESFWIDEGQSWHYAQRSGSGFVRALRVDPSMPLYYILLHFWLELGQSEAFIRALSAVFTVACIPLVYLLGKRLLDVQTAVIAALLLGINQFAIVFGQEARGYALTQFLVTLATVLFSRALSMRSGAAWAAYGLAACLAVTSHAFALYILASHFLTFLFARRNELPWKPIAAFLGLVVVLGSGLLIGPLGQVTRRNRFFWIEEPTFDRVVSGIGALTGQATGAYALPYLLVLLAGAILLTRRLLAIEAPEKWKFFFVLGLGIVPLVGSVVVSWWIPMFVPRYLIVALPGLVLVAAFAIRSPARPALSWGILGLLLAIGTQTLNVHYRTAHKEDWRQATRTITTEALPSDHIVFIAPSGVAPYLFYRELAGTGDSPPALLYPAYRPEIQDFDRSAIPELVETIPSLSGRVWLVLAYEWLGPRARGAAQQVQATLADHSDSIEPRTIRGIKIFLYDLRS